MTAPRFQPGDAVSVALRHVAGHCRTPWYVRGRQGTVERVCGPFGNPESLGHGGDGRPYQYLYRVRFVRSTLWATAEPGSVDVEIYEHWLDAVPSGR